MTIEELVKLIQKGVPDAEVYARDLTGEGNHFEAFVVSPHFTTKSRVQRQQMVYSGMTEALKGPLHALTMKTYTPEEWAQAQA